MKPHLFTAVNLLAALFPLATGVADLAAADSPANKPVLLYSRYFNAVGEARYLPDGTYKEVLTRLRTEFDVRVHSRPLNARALASVKVVLIAKETLFQKDTNADGSPIKEVVSKK